jgi:hypothetical protein
MTIEKAKIINNVEPALELRTILDHPLAICYIGLSANLDYS